MDELNPSMKVSLNQKRVSVLKVIACIYKNIHELNTLCGQSG